MDTKSTYRRVNRAQQRASRTRQKLLVAALTEFSERGVDVVSIHDITERADVGKGTFYKHFSDKYELMIALVEEAVNNLISRMRDIARPGSLEAVLEHLLDAHTAFFVDRGEEFILLFQGRVLLKLQRASIENLEQPYLRYLEEIEQQISPYISNRADQAKIRRVACAVAGFVFGFFSFAMIGMTSEEIETSLSPLRRAFVSGLSVFLER